MSLLTRPLQVPRCLHGAEGRPLSQVSPFPHRWAWHEGQAQRVCGLPLSPQPQPPRTHPQTAHSRSSTGPPAVPAAARSLSPSATPAVCPRWWHSVPHTAPPCLPRVHLTCLGCPPGGSDGSHWRPQLATQPAPPRSADQGLRCRPFPHRTKLVTNPTHLRPQPSRPHSRGRLQPPRKMRAGPAQQNTRRAVPLQRAHPPPGLALAPANHQLEASSREPPEFPQGGLREPKNTGELQQAPARGSAARPAAAQRATEEVSRPG